MNAFMEKKYPVVLGGLSTLLYIALRHRVALPPSTKDLLTSVLTVSSIAIGFLATAKSIMLSMDKKRVIRQLKDIGQYDTVLCYLMTAVNWLFGCAIVTAVILLVDSSKQPRWFPWAFAIWLFITVTSAAACYRVIRIFHKILRSGE